MLCCKNCKKCVFAKLKITIFYYLYRARDVVHLTDHKVLKVFWGNIESRKQWSSLNLFFKASVKLKCLTYIFLSTQYNIQLGSFEIMGHTVAFYRWAYIHYCVCIRLGIAALRKQYYVDALCLFNKRLKSPICRGNFHKNQIHLHRWKASYHYINIYVLKQKNVFLYVLSALVLSDVQLYELQVTWSAVIGSSYAKENTV